jgi:uncharacterized membrane protein
MAIIVAIVFAFIMLLLGPGGGAYATRVVASAQLHAPNWGLIAEAPIAIKIHLATVLAALVVATFQMVGPKGTTVHRVTGWTLSVLFVITAVAALFIRNPQGGLFNPFQLFSVWTLIAVPWAVLAARAHNVRRHASIMMGFYFGGMILAGLLTFLPGRLMWRVFFG